MDDEPLLRLEEVDVFYGAVQALFGVTLAVGAGEVVAVLGGNASGKSTTIKTVLGLVRPRSGRVLFEGRDLRNLVPWQRIGLGIGSVPEGRRLFPEMTVRENLLLGAYARRHEPPAALEDALEEALELFPTLKDRLAQPAGTLSGGEQQMVALGRALMRRPRLLCIDEPSMGLSPLYVDRVYDVLAALKVRGVTILLVEQSAHRALELADRAYVLQNGRIVLEGVASSLVEDPMVRRAYLGGLDGEMGAAEKGVEAPWVQR